MADNPVMFLIASGKKSGNVDERQERNIEAVAEADKAGGLIGSMIIDRPGHEVRLVGDYSDRFSVQPGEAHDDIQRERRLNFEKAVFVGERGDNVFNIVWGLIRSG